MDTLPFHLLDDILLKLDPKSLAMMQCAGRSINLHITDDPYFKTVFKKDRYDEGVVHGNDLRANKWGGVMDWIPQWWDGERDFYQFKPSLSSSMEVDEEVDVEMTMVNHDDDKHMSSLSKFMRRIGGISPYAQSVFKKKETPHGKRLMIEDETKLKMMTEEPSSKFMDAAERIIKRRRVSNRQNSYCG